MFGMEVILIMLVLRVAIPVGLLLWIGEIVRQRQQIPAPRWMTGRA